MDESNELGTLNLQLLRLFRNESFRFVQLRLKNSGLVLFRESMITQRLEFVLEVIDVRNPIRFRHA